MGGCCLGVHIVWIFSSLYRRCGDCTYFSYFWRSLSFFTFFSFVLYSLSLYLSIYLPLLLFYCLYCLYSLYLCSLRGGPSSSNGVCSFPTCTRRTRQGYATLRYPPHHHHHKNTNTNTKHNPSTPPMSRVAISLANAVLRVRVRVRANAAETRVLAVREERVDIAVTAPARDGAASRGAVAVVSKVRVFFFVPWVWLVGWGLR